MAYTVADAIVQPLRSKPVVLGDDGSTDRPQRNDYFAAAVLAISACGTACFLSIWFLRSRRLGKVLEDAEPTHQGRVCNALQSMGETIPLRCSRSIREPSVFGIFRHVLLWPNGLSERLDDEDVHAIVAHEVTHVRHRDNLIATIHMIVEAVFWFHPLVWWIERQIVLERENVCDECVVRTLGNNEAYAESLLKVGRHCVAPGLPYISRAAGADLAKRIVTIMTNRFEKLSPARTMILVVSGVATVLIPIAFGMVHALPAYGQVLYSEGPLPVFEVATIRPMQNAPTAPPPQGGSTVHFYFTTKILIMYAFNLPDFSEEEILKGTGWMDDYYDIQAKIGDAEFTGMQKMSAAERQERIQLMCQSFLKERFKLKVHLEKREQTIYALEVTKTGPKLTAAKIDRPGRFNVTPKGQSYELKADGVNLDELASLLGRQSEIAGRRTVNKTGLNGRYDVTLHWSRAETASSETASSSEGNAPSFFTAIREQLGLGLASTKGPVDYVVVDHIDRPSSN